MTQVKQIDHEAIFKHETGHNFPVPKSVMHFSKTKRPIAGGIDKK
jgi:hypothetical protein